MRKLPCCRKRSRFPKSAVIRDTQFSQFYKFSTLIMTHLFKSWQLRLQEKEQVSQIEKLSRDKFNFEVGTQDFGVKMSFILDINKLYTF